MNNKDTIFILDRRNYSNMGDIITGNLYAVLNLLGSTT